MKTVGIIGGSGFIGSYVTKKFLEEKYKVKVSSTDISNKSKYEHLQGLANAENLEICAVDMRYIKSIKAFAKGCSIIVHSGTPFMLDVKNPKTELLEPTVKGTENFLHVIANTKGLMKVVLIASVAAWNTSFPLPPATYPSNYIFSEQDIPCIRQADHPYARAKFLADQAVKKFISDHPYCTFEITSISPAMVIGKSLSSRQDSTAIGLQYLIKNKIANNPFLKMIYAADVMFAMTDVRNVAESVFQAATRNGLHGKNYMIANESYTVSDISRMLNNEPPLAEASLIYSNALAKKNLGVAFITARETLNYYA